MRIEPRLVECQFDPNTFGRRRVSDIDTVMFHRIDDAENAEELAAWFREHGKAEIGTSNMPYTFVITRAGVIEQANGLLVSAPHACSWNKRSVGVGVIGDFRRGHPTGKPPTSEQFDACVWLARRLWDRMGRPLLLCGHTTQKGATHDVGKVCPGGLFPLDEIVQTVQRLNEIVV